MVSGKTAGVFHLQSPSGKYKMNFSQADAACQSEGATLATFKQLGDAQQVFPSTQRQMFVKDASTGEQSWLLPV